MESTLEFLKRKLKEAGPERWPEIVLATGVAKTLPRKLAYGDRPNPGIQTVQPLLDYFDYPAAANDAPQQPAPGAPPAAVSTHHDTGERRRATDIEPHATAGGG